MKAMDDNKQEFSRIVGIGEDEVLGEQLEVDSDVNEDRNRELQLDDSFEDWYRNIGYWVRQKEDITQVPKENVFDAIADKDTGQEST